MVNVTDEDREYFLKLLPIVSRETVADLVFFTQAVGKWQQRINLVAPSTLPDLWHRHIADCAQLYFLAPSGANWLDIGSGGGFPGIVTAIMLKHSGKGHIELVESNHKKAAFLQIVAAQLALPAIVHTQRIGAIVRLSRAPEVITARAFASLAHIFTVIERWMTADSIALLQKGRDYQREYQEATANWHCNLLIHKSKIDDQSVILEVKDLRSRRGKAY